MDYIYSISIPHYNSPVLLRRMLKSIPEREDIQLIVVDDGSSEENVNALKKLQHKNLELVFLEENRGGGYARNIGLQHAKGKWFISVDADDYFSDDAFDVFDKYKDEQIDCLYFCVQCVDTETGEVTRELVANKNVSKYLKDSSKKAEQLLRFHNLESWNKLVSMKFIKKNNISYENCRI
ncbi:MAG: glycosyltransferase family 2 protein, partial [Prevotella sp.]|nr:glycosyltransferase family 2 protein [Prevotella sp.]